MIATDSPAAAGVAHLTFTRSGANTVLTRAYATSPAKLFATHGLAPTCWVFSGNFGGGLVGGDDLRLTVEVTPGASALLTTQASTKVYRSARQSRQSIAATVADGGFLAVLPDPVVCFASADFAQKQQYDLTGSAGLVVVDWVTSGRHAAGERWAFSRYESRMAIVRDATPVFLDGLVLEHDLDAPADRLAGFNVLLTMVVSGPELSGHAKVLVDRIASEPLNASTPPLVASAVRLGEDGALIRMAGASVEQVGRALRAHLSFLTPMIGDDLWSRKW